MLAYDIVYNIIVNLGRTCGCGDNSHKHIWSRSNNRVWRRNCLCGNNNFHYKKDYKKKE